MVERVRIAGVEVDVLIDTGASASCCRWGWYKKYSSHLGPLIRSDTVVFGVENRPISVRGVTRPVCLQWGSVTSQLTLTVIPTLEDQDVILGMDILSQMNVIVNTESARAWPRPNPGAREGVPLYSQRAALSEPQGVPTVMQESIKIPAGKSRVFFC